MIALLRVISCTTLVLLQSICHHSKVLNPSHRRREHEPRITFPNNIIVAQSNLVRLPLHLLSTFIFVALAGPNSLCYISILNPYMAYTSLCDEDKWKVFISVWYSSSEILGFVGNVLCYRKYYFCIYTLLWDIIWYHPHQFVRADKYLSGVSPLPHRWFLTRTEEEGRRCRGKRTSTTIWCATLTASASRPLPSSATTAASGPRASSSLRYPPLSFRFASWLRLSISLICLCSLDLMDDRCSGRSVWSIVVLIFFSF